ncbi:argininosuccinate synthase-related protein [Streptomyces heilongjiangensis]
MRSSGLVRSFREIEKGGIDLNRPVVTLFSGGLDSTYLLYRLQQAGATQVHALSVDLGGDETPDLALIVDKLGVRLHTVDARDLFAEGYVAPAVAAHAVYLDTHPISSSLSRPLIAKIAIETAERVCAPTVLHTANRSQNSLRRLNGALELLGFAGHFGSPYDLEPVDRADKMRELRSLGLDVVAERAVSGDSNLWCREFESGFLDDPESHLVPESLYRWSVPATAPLNEQIEISFRDGVPVAIDGARLPLAALVDLLNRRVGRHGLGRSSGLEHLADGTKVLEIREMPAAWLLLRSHRALESATLDAEVIREKLHVEQLWVREALEGRWFGELRNACQAFIASTSSAVTGTVRWHLTVAGANTTSIVAACPRYVRDREQWERSSIQAELNHLV